MRGMSLLFSLAVLGIIGGSGSPALAQAQSTENTGAFEEVATLESADTENIWGASDGTMYVTSMGGGGVVWKVTPDRKVTKFLTVPNVANVLGVANAGEGFALTVTERPHRKPGPDGRPQFDLADVGPQVVLLDKNGKVTATLPGPKGSFFNGITSQATKRGMYLLADSTTGFIWQVDAKKRKLDPWLKEAALANGANGIKVHDSWVYINGRSDMYRVKLDKDGRPEGSLTKFAEGVRTDDFDIAKDGTIYLTSMSKISPAGVIIPFLEKVPTGPAVMISRDGKWLYWPTRGGPGPQRLLRARIQ